MLWDRQCIMVGCGSGATVLSSLRGPVWKARFSRRFSTRCGPHPCLCITLVTSPSQSAPKRNRDFAQEPQLGQVVLFWKLTGCTKPFGCVTSHVARSALCRLTWTSVHFCQNRLCINYLQSRAYNCLCSWCKHIHSTTSAVAVLWH